jgi:hypothetical protein
MRLNHLKRVTYLGLAEAGCWRVGRERNPYLLVRGEGSLLVVILPSPV